MTELQKQLEEARKSPDYAKELARLDAESLASSPCSPLEIPLGIYKFEKEGNVSYKHASFGGTDEWDQLILAANANGIQFEVILRANAKVCQPSDEKRS